MSEQDEVLQLEGIVHLRHIYLSPPPRSLGAELESSDARWEIADSGQGSPYHAFAERRVVVSGEPYHACGPQRLWRWGDKPIRHFRVSTMRLVEVTPDSELIEVGAPQHLSGRFERDASGTGRSTLSFDTEKGDTYRVANDPAEVNVGCGVKVQAYPVEPSPSMRRSPEQYLWIICPCWCADCFKERHRRRSP